MNIRPNRLHLNLMEEEKGYTRLGVNHHDKKGNAVFAYRCNICKGEFTNSNNACTHVRACRLNHANAMNQRAFPILRAFGITPSQLPMEAVFPPHIDARSEPGAQLSHEHKALIELIADMNIPYTQLESPTWERFIHSLSPGFKIPKKDSLRMMIIEHSNNLLKESLSDCRGLTCGIAVDGATIFEYHTYAFILIHPHGLRLAGIKIVQDQKGATLAGATASVLKTCIENEVHISGIVSDNAASLVAALTNMNPTDPVSIKYLIGMAILRCACAAHTSQLAVGDVIKTSSTLERFFNEITSLLYWINKRSHDFKNFCPVKVPQYIATRWNTLASCGNFIIKNKEQVNDFISRRTEQEAAEYEVNLQLYQKGKKRAAPEEPSPPPVSSVPDEWESYVDALSTIASFTDSIEGDLKLQQQVYTSVVETEAKLENMSSHGNIIAKHLLEAFRIRFMTTADLTLAHLAFTLTPVGLNALQALPNDHEKRATTKKLKDKFLEIAHSLDFDALGSSALFLPALFDNFIKFGHIDEGEDPFIFWEEKMDDSIIIPQLNSGKEISWSVFATIALTLISLPASEAMVERAFSTIKVLVTDFNKRISDDLFVALSSIKLCIRYKNKYNFRIK